MALTGKQLINGQWQTGEVGTFSAKDPSNGATLVPEYGIASLQQVDAAVAAAADAFAVYRQTSLAQRSAFLHACADEIMALGDALSEQVMAETGYPKGRAEGERARTCGQLHMFADYILGGEYLDPRIDTAMPDRQPIPRPDLRYVNQALGPVVVFGASNFPLAYSVAGGDTASALAAGCPVIVKGHPSHPGTGELVAQALFSAAQKTGMPAAVIQLLNDVGHEVGSALVQAPAIKAVGFTGSLKGGMALFNLANARPEPIPVFAEMGSINPVVMLPKALAQSAKELATGFVGSLTMGTGQFCVNPGLILAIDNADLTTFIDATAAALSAVPAGVMLNAGICSAYEQGASHFTDIAGVEEVGSGGNTEANSGSYAQAKLLTTDAATFLAQPALQEEVFGPLSLVVKCQNTQQIKQIINSLKGQLTGTLRAADDAELAEHLDLIDAFSQRVGRVVINGFPTGVEVCPAMVHGGPFPASTDSRFTSVGTAAIARFVRPVCYQAVPDGLLPAALQNANPLALTRVVNGNPTKDPIA
ncbi:aldehyde dehydrogenase (NADP(+)) [Alteromonadaceae bacterium BrNp21-10]|nr:aldehyde dehydrogenase (NADP(+)) [Alteromonadaceae bacterium BrNp21-10]